jgi:hypothetical protein
MCDAVDFVTARNRMAAWGSHGGREFQPHRAHPPNPAPLATRLGDVKALRAELLHYFVRQHLVKPLVLVPRFRVPLLQEVLRLSVATFTQCVERAEAAFPAQAPFHLEDRILMVDHDWHDVIYGALRRALADADPGRSQQQPAGGMPFYCHDA